MEKLISVVGLTSSGKSDLGIALALEFNGEIVSADSRQVYKGLDWCSGKVTKEEQEQVVHHLLDVASLGERFTLFDYQAAAYEKIDDIISRGKIPFLVGGTGLYTRSVVQGFNLVEEKPDKNEREMYEKLDKNELIMLCKKKGIDIPAEVTARRLVRILEKNGEENENSPRYKVLQIGIKWEREEIYNRIKIRLERRMPNMIEEIKNLLESGVDAEFLRSLGLEAKYVVDYLDGKFENYTVFFEELFKEERHFAKRQNTWFNKEQDTVWLNANENLIPNAIKLVREFLAE
ncbi:MAG: tRNA (adenosine(37)-N6)-dimethylallyltransferase MiaA [Clostridia bacterium]|nr:tRNA (adenosine(37)-N6)-dimethylallyltransferase MiaA [Clostridia bacterium]